MKIWNILIFLLAVSIVSCNEAERTESTNQSRKRTIVYDTTATGLVYRKLSNGNGRLLEKGDLAIIHLAGYLRGGDKEIINTWSKKSPKHIDVGAGQVVEGLEEGLLMMKIGDSYEFIIPPKLGFGDQRVAGIPANSKLTYQVQVLGLKERKQIVQFDTTGIVPEITGSGISIYWIEKGEGKRPEPGQMVKVNYQGTFLDGKKFDSSYDRGNPIQFNVGKRQVIRGWDELLQLMREGDKVKAVIPYYLAYGENGKVGHIPPKTDLVFDIELIEVN